MAYSTFPLQAGMHQLNVNFSFLANATPSTIRDGKSGIVLSVVRTGAGHYTATMRDLLGKCVSGHACIEAVDDTPTDSTCQFRYIQATKIIKVYILTGAVLTDPEVGDRVNFSGTFWMRQDVQES